MKQRLDMKTAKQFVLPHQGEIPAQAVALTRRKERGSTARNPLNGHANSSSVAGFQVTLGSAETVGVVGQLSSLQIIINGQIAGGKNNIRVTKTGHRYPDKRWAKWRDQAVANVKSQLPSDFKIIDGPVNICLEYVSGDKRRRDMPAIVDSIFHCLERAGVVTDDTHLWIVESSRDYDKIHPRAEITFY